MALPSDHARCGSTRGVIGHQPGAKRIVAKVVLEQSKCGVLQLGNAHPLPPWAVPQPVKHCLVRELAMRAQLPTGHPLGRHALGDRAASHQHPQSGLLDLRPVGGPQVRQRGCPVDTFANSLKEGPTLAEAMKLMRAEGG